MTQTLPAGVRLISPPERPFLVLEARTTLILDWDIYDPEKTELVEASDTESGCCTITTGEEAVELLEAYNDLNRDQLWAVYTTGNGVRALRLDKAFPTDHPSVNALVSILDPDALYVSSSIVREHWAARVSHKAGRAVEEIRFLKWVGDGTAMSQQWEVFKLHHELLLEHGLTAIPFSDLVEALETHLKVPSAESTPVYNAV